MEVHLGSPACAGIGPKSTSLLPLHQRFPRMRGDRPGTLTSHLLSEEVPPHARRRRSYLLVAPFRSAATPKAAASESRVATTARMTSAHGIASIVPQETNAEEGSSSVTQSTRPIGIRSDGDLTVDTVLVQNIVVVGSVPGQQDETTLVTFAARAAVIFGDHLVGSVGGLTRRRCVSFPPDIHGSGPEGDTGLDLVVRLEGCATFKLADRECHVTTRNPSCSLGSCLHPKRSVTASGGTWTPTLSALIARKRLSDRWLANRSASMTSTEKTCP